MKNLFCAFVLCSVSYAASSQPVSRISADAKAADPSSTVQVIIQWKIPVGTARQLKIGLLKGVTIAEFRSVNSGVYQLPATALSSLENDADVAYVSMDRAVHHKLDLTTAAVNAPTAWNVGKIGTGIGVAVIDSGINLDVNLAFIAYSQDFTGAKGANIGKDQYGHGEHVAGIIASTGIASSVPLPPISSYTRNFKGMAPGVSLINLRVLDQNGVGSDSNIIAAIDTAISLKTLLNIRVINLSLGRPVFESYTLDPLCQAVEAAWKAGIVVVVAAGNDGRDNSFGTTGYGTIDAPGNDPYVITVGAMKTEGTDSRSDDLIASYSAKGPTQVDHIVKPDILAPGNQVVSLLAAGSTLLAAYPANQVLNSYYESTNNGQGKKNSQNFFTLSGTSMAAPVVSGAVADLLQAQPTLTPDQIKTLLMQTASKSFPFSSAVLDSASGITYTSYYDIFTVGAGYLDLGAALAAIASVPTSGTAMSPVATYDPATGIVAVVFGSNSVFSTQSVWGTEAVWGARAVWGPSVLTSSNQAIWASRCVWGATSPSSQTSVTGARAVWAAQAIWASTTTSSESLPVSILGEQ